MAIRNPHQRVGVFVDVQNLYYSARNIYSARVNFSEVLKAAVGDRLLIRSIAYGIKADMPEEHTFFEALDKAGYEVKTKDLQTFYGGMQKGDWDVGIAIDIIKLMSKLDVVVLCCGDGDFIPLIEFLQMNGQFVEVCSFGKSTALKVKEIADNFIDLDLEPKKFLFPMKGRALKLFNPKRTESEKKAVEKLEHVNQDIIMPSIRGKRSFTDADEEMEWGA